MLGFLKYIYNSFKKNRKNIHLRLNFGAFSLREKGRREEAFYREGARERRTAGGGRLTAGGGSGGRAWSTVPGHAGT